MRCERSRPPSGGRLDRRTRVSVALLARSATLGCQSIPAVVFDGHVIPCGPAWPAANVFAADNRNLISLGFLDQRIAAGTAFDVHTHVEVLH